MSAHGKWRWTIALFIGVVIEIILHSGLREHRWIAGIEDRAMDWVISLRRLDQPSRHQQIPFTFLDIDEGTYRAWGNPLFVPRDKIRQILEFAIASNPALIIVDVDLNTPAPNPGSEDLTRDDLALAQMFRNYKGSAPIILTRRLQKSLDRPLQSENRVEPFGEVAPSFLDEAVKSNPDRLLWGSSLFQRSEDGAIRRWSLWTYSCQNSNYGCQLSALPSIQLLSAALLLEPETRPQGLVKRISETVLSLAQNICISKATGPRQICRMALKPSAKTQTGSLVLGGLHLSIPPSRLNQRIFYRYPFTEALAPGEGYPTHPGHQTKLLTVLPASVLTQAIQEGRTVSLEPFRKKIIVLGGSFEAGRDIHPTPLGLMPGALVLINALDSLLEYEEIKQLPWYWRYPIVVLLILVVCTIFTTIGSKVGGYVAAGFVILAILPISVWALDEGYWLDFSMPLIGVILHKLVSEWE